MEFVPDGSEPTLESELKQVFIEVVSLLLLLLPTDKVFGSASRQRQE
jgi:hypothetical protein